MTVPLLKIKVLQRPVVKGKMDVRFPGSVTAEAPIALDKTGGNFVFSIDINSLSDMLSTIFQPFEGVLQHITDPGPVTVWDNAGIVLVDQTVAAAITLNLPPAANKICPVLISDWKGDAGTNNITNNVTGADKFPGGLTSWKIAADTGSIFLRPIAGVGYAL